jgi:hypothetical protein
MFDPQLLDCYGLLILQEWWQVGRRIDESENGRCGFLNCFHVGEPYCAVGTDWDRHSHYTALLEEVRNREKVEKRVLGTKRESEVR